MVRGSDALVGITFITKLCESNLTSRSGATSSMEFSVLFTTAKFILFNFSLSLVRSNINTMRSSKLYQVNLSVMVRPSEANEYDVLRMNMKKIKNVLIVCMILILHVLSY